MSKRISVQAMHKKAKRNRSVHVKRRNFFFRKGDIVEWTEWKQGVPSKHEGEVIGNGGLFKHIIIGSDANVGDIRVAHRLRADYYTVEDFANNESHVIHGSRLIRIKMKVAFD